MWKASEALNPTEHQAEKFTPEGKIVFWKLAHDSRVYIRLSLLESCMHHHKLRIQYIGGEKKVAVEIKFPYFDIHPK